MKVISNPATSDPRLDLGMRKRSRLLSAIRQLETGGQPSANRRIALAEAHFRLAVLQGTDFDEAIEHIQKAIAYDPFHPKFYFHLGRLLHRSGDHRGAVLEYRHTLKLAPNSHRAYVHLALALLEPGTKEEQEVGRALLDTLSRGEEYKLGEHLSQLDALLEAQRSGGDGKKSPSVKPAHRDSKQRAKEDSGDGDSKQARVPCRWNGIWRVSLMGHLSGPKLNPKQIEGQLTEGAKPVNGRVRVAEYATAGLFWMLSGESSKAIGKMLEGPALKSCGEHPAVQLLSTAVALAESESHEQFIERAVTDLQGEHLPLELVCYLHYAKYGPDSSLPVEEVLPLLDSYPPVIQQCDCFKELRLAVLDGYARRAWAEERFDHARLLWRETLSLDPHRIAIAHNLALLAARTKSYDDYSAAWEHAAELRYLQAAAAGDVQVNLEERRTMHLSFAQQCKQRYCRSGTSHNQAPQKEELEAWIADRDVIEVWLREWDLYYVNSRLRFRSPVHLLGIPRDATEQTATDARDALLCQIKMSLSGQSWTGIRTFCNLAEKLVGKAFEHAIDLVERVRDPYYEQEKSDADTLTREAIDRGFLMLHLLEALIRKASTKNITVGCAIARYLFALPWKVLQPVCADRGLIERDLDLVKVFENHLLALATADKAEPAVDREVPEDQEVSERLSALDECIAILPHRVELIMARCQLLLTAKRNFDAYSSALAAFPLISNIGDKEDANTIEKNFMILIDNAAFSELPERVRQPDSLEGAKETLREGRRVLERFPRAGGLRTYLVNLMIQIGDESHTRDAIELLEEGLELALNDEQKQQFQDLLKQGHAQSKVARVMQEIRNLLEGSSKSVNEVLEEISQGATVESLQRGRDVVARAIQDAERAKKLAEESNIKEAEDQAKELIRQLREVQKKLQSC